MRDDMLATEAKDSMKDNPRFPSDYKALSLKWCPLMVCLTSVRFSNEQLYNQIRTKVKGSTNWPFLVVCLLIKSGITNTPGVFGSGGIFDLKKSGFDEVPFKP